jgi:N-dimethylarginine dimethylaminohydrolase
MAEKKTGVYNSTGKLKRVLLARADNYDILPISDMSRDRDDAGEVISTEQKLKEYQALVDVFEELNIEISWVDELTPDLPWQMFTRDFGVNTPDGILVGRFRYVERKGEEVIVKKVIEQQGENLLAGQITRGAMEGGDCYMLDEDTLVIGNGNRSTYAGFENAKEIMAEYGRQVFVVEFLSKWNHLDTIFQPVADKLAVISSVAVPDYFIGFLHGKGWELIDVPEENIWRCEINFLALGEDRVLSFEGNQINEILKAHGIEVYDPPFNIFAKGGGGPHCSTFELEREP